MVPAASTPVSATIVLLNYNQGRLAAEALAAILAQTRRPDEVICVDDGSTDDSLAILGAVANSADAVRLIRHDRNLGVVAAMNSGLGAATGDFVLFAAADDRLAPDMVARCMAAMSMAPTTGLTFSDPAEKDAATGKVTIYPLYLSDGAREYTPEQFVQLIRANFFHFSNGNVFFNRRALLELGGFDPTLRWHADMFASFALACRRGALYVPKAFSYFSVDKTSYSAKGRAGSAQQTVMVRWFEKLAEPGNADLAAAFRRGGILPDFSKAALMAMLQVAGSASPCLIGRTLSRSLWGLVRPLAAPALRRAMRRLTAIIHG